MDVARPPAIQIARVVRRCGVWRLRVASSLTLLLVTVAHRTVLGQSLEVTGRVSDHTGGVLPGVSVQLRAEGSSEIVEAVTDALGRYKVQASRPGRHQIRFSLINFTHVHEADHARRQPAGGRRCRAAAGVDR